MIPEPSSDGGGRETKLTPAQIENWRNVLFAMLGGYALIMPADDIQAFADKIQDAIINNPPPNRKVKYEN